MLFAVFYSNIIVLRNKVYSVVHCLQILTFVYYIRICMLFSTIWYSSDFFKLTFLRIMYIA